MLAAFTYWQLHVGWGLGTWPSLLLVVFVIAPIFGAIVEWGLIRGLEDASEVVRIVVTTSLMIGLLGLARLVWPSGVNRNITGFYGSNTVDVLGTAVTIHRLIMVGVALVVAVVLWVLLNRTRMGVTMRAVVDDRALLQLNGGRPALVSMFSWALGAALAAVAGILIAPIQNLEPITLTLLVVTAYSAAAIGRLRSLPLTFLGALIVGLGEAYLKGYISTDMTIGSFQLDKLATAFSPIVLLIALVFLPQPKLRTSGQHARREHWPMPTMRAAVAGGAAVVVVAVAISALIQPVEQLLVVDGLFFALVALSLVPLTGFAGQISLAQVTFAGVGGIVAAMIGANLEPLNVVIAVAVTAIFGALVALPALRLQGIYLALATAALAILVYQLVFLQPAVMPGNNRQVPALGVGDWKASTTLGQIIVLSVAFGLVGIGLVALRRGAWGRRLTAMKDSHVACATLGLHLTRTKVATFALSAGIAGLAGAVAGQTFTTDQLRFEANFPVTMFAVVGGVGAVSGALIGGIMLGVLPVMNSVFAANSIGWFKMAELQVTKLTAVLPGLIGVSLGRNPTGVTTQVSEGFEPVRRRPVAGVAALVAAVVIWALAWRDVIDGWTFTAAIVALIAVLPGVAAVVGLRVEPVRRVVVVAVALLGVAGALVIPWADLSDSNGVRFVALLAYAVALGVAAGAVAGVLETTDEEPSADLAGITFPLDRSDIVEAERVLGITEEDLVGAP
jgi:branched-chain amino acid transport system permease protein